jgi:hypothetical protein
MGLDDTTEPRVVAHNLTPDDPTWGQVASFFDAADSAYSEVPSPTHQSVHLAAISQAVRDDAPRRDQPMLDMNTRRRGRTALGALLASTVLAIAGVTAAAAFGGLGQPQPQPEPASMLMDATPDPADTKAGEEGNDADDQAKPKALEKMHTVNTGTSNKPAPQPAAPPKAAYHEDDHGDDDGHDDDSEEHSEDHEDESDD